MLIYLLNRVIFPIRKNCEFTGRIPSELDTRHAICQGCEGKLEEMRDLLAWTPMSSAHAVVDQELRHRHCQGKSRRLAPQAEGDVDGLFNR